VSCHADGFDVWRERASFSPGVSAGCPPDVSHVHGQDWGILCLNPRELRETGYRYLRNSLGAHMRYAAYLRLDHVACLYRLWWVPYGLGAKNGAYARYAMDELFALLILESHRHRCTLIGEDLGTVPPEVRDGMDAHGVLRMYALQRRLTGDGSAEGKLFPDFPTNSICSLNTHDMPPFAAFWKGHDILDKLDLKYFPPTELPQKQAARGEQKAALVDFLAREGHYADAASPAPVAPANETPAFEGQELPEEVAGHSLGETLRAVLRYNAQHPVEIMQVNVEDLWLEILPQNLPGTWKERPNWRRRARRSLEELVATPEYAELFAELLALRREWSGG
jgi:4-alpha-glucanotransferase